MPLSYSSFLPQCREVSICTENRFFHPLCFGGLIYTYLMYFLCVGLGIEYRAQIQRFMLDKHPLTEPHTWPSNSLLTCAIIYIICLYHCKNEIHGVQAALLIITIHVGVSTWENVS